MLSGFSPKWTLESSDQCGLSPDSPLQKFASGSILNSGFKCDGSWLFPTYVQAYAAYNCKLHPHHFSACPVGLTDLTASRQFSTRDGVFGCNWQATDTRISTPNGASPNAGSAFTVGGRAKWKLRQTRRHGSRWALARLGSEPPAEGRSATDMD